MAGISKPIRAWEQNKPDNVSFEEFKLKAGIVTRAIALATVKSQTRRVTYDSSGRCVLPVRMADLDIRF